MITADAMTFADMSSYFKRIPVPTGIDSAPQEFPESPATPDVYLPFLWAVPRLLYLRCAQCLSPSINSKYERRPECASSLHLTSIRRVPRSRSYPALRGPEESAQELRNELALRLRSLLPPPSDTPIRQKGVELDISK